MDLSLEGRGLRKEALQQWGDWLQEQWRWDWFVTLTFDNRKLPVLGTRTIVGWRASAQAWDRWLDGLADRSGLWEPRVAGALPSDAYWVRGREPNPHRKGTHFHALIGGVPITASRRDAWAAWFHEYGLARILPYDPSLGAAHYLTKYVVKELGDVQFSDNIKLWKGSVS